MLDLTNIKTRYYDVKISDAGGQEILLHVKPCKIKVLNKLIKAAKGFDTTDDDTEAMAMALDDLYEAVSKLLSSNRDGISISADDIQGLTLDQLMALVTGYFSWLSSQKKSKS